MSIATIKASIYTLLSAVTVKSYPVVGPQEETSAYAVYLTRFEPVRDQVSINIYDCSLTLNIYANDMSDCITLAGQFFTAIEDASGTYGANDLEVGYFISESDDYIENLDKYVITQEWQLRWN